MLLLMIPSHTTAVSAVPQYHHHSPILSVFFSELMYQNGRRLPRPRQSSDWRLLMVSVEVVDGIKSWLWQLTRLPDSDEGTLSPPLEPTKSLMLCRIWQVTAMKRKICLMSLWKMVWPHSWDFGICQVSCSWGSIWILEQLQLMPPPMASGLTPERQALLLEPLHSNPHR
jgi:hypothetical protein